MFCLVLFNNTENKSTNVKTLLSVCPRQQCNYQMHHHGNMKHAEVFDTFVQF